MKQFSRVTAIIVLILSLALLSLGAKAQSVEQKGNVFVAKKSTHDGQVTKTNYIYEDSKGRQDTIYLSSTGKAFVWRVSKNGNTYKKYLPEVTRKINPQAYDDKKTKSSK